MMFAKLQELISFMVENCFFRCTVLLILTRASPRSDEVKIYIRQHQQLSLCQIPELEVSFLKTDAV